MPSGAKYERHQMAVQFLKETKMVDWAGSYKEFADEFGKDQKYKNSDLICITNHQISSFEIKCHKKSDYKLMQKRSLLVEGRSSVNHSYSMVNQYSNTLS